MESTKFKFSKNYQLTLPLISLSDIYAVDDLLEQSLYEGIEAKANEVIYDKIPAMFTTLSEWPLTTNLCCWFCTRSFSSRPWFVPLQLKQNAEDPDQIEIKTDGNYCSANCVVAVINKMDRSIRESVFRNLFIIVKMFTGRDITTITPAHDKNRMKKYGGEYTEEEYNAAMASIAIEIPSSYTSKQEVVTVYDFYKPSTSV